MVTKNKVKGVIYTCIYISSFLYIFVFSVSHFELKWVNMSKSSRKKFEKKDAEEIMYISWASRDTPNV